MAVPVSLALKGEGIPEVRAAIQSVRHSFIEMDQAALASSDTASRKRIANLRAEARIKLSLLREDEQARVRSVRERSENAFAYATGHRMATDDGMGLSGIAKGAGIAGLAAGAMASAINLATASLKQFASFVINDVIKPSLALNTKAVQVANNSGGALTAGGIEARAKAVGLRNNLDPMGLVAAAGNFQDLTGESKMGFDMLPMIGAISKGRPDQDPATLSKMAAGFYKSGMTSDQLEKLMLAQVKQAEVGGVPLSALAPMGRRVTAPGEHFGGDWFTKATTASALLQTAKKGAFGSPEEAVTGLERFTEDAMRLGGNYSRRSFATVNGANTLTAPIHYLGDLFRKFGAGPKGFDTAAMEKAGFTKPATQFAGAYLGQYQEAYAGAKSGGKNEAQAREAGAQAVEDFVTSMANQTSSMAEESAKRDAVMETDGEAMEKAIGDIKAAIDTDMRTAVHDFAALLVDHKADIIDFAKAVLDTTTALIGFVDDVKNLVNVTPIMASEGSVLKHAADRGERTELGGSSTFDVLGGEHKGYWRKSARGDFELVQGANPGEDQKGAWKRDKNGTQYFAPEWAKEEDTSHLGLKGFLGSKEFKDVVAKKDSSEAEPTPEKNYSDAGGAQDDAGDGAAVASEALGPLADNTVKAASSVERLSSSIDDLVSRMDTLSRSEAFTSR